MKVFGTLMGLAFLGLIGLMFWWLYWEAISKVHIADLKQQLVVLESFWNRQSGVRDGKLTLGYSDIAPSGFPLGMRVRLLQPFIRDTRANHSFTLTASYVDLIPESLAAQRFRIEYPADAQVIVKSGSSAKHYYLHLSALPPVFAQKVEVGGRAPGAVNQYGVQFPSQLILTADTGGIVKRYPFRLMATDEVMYRPLIRNVRERLGWLHQLLKSGGV
jgi:hypothetical protein